MDATAAAPFPGRGRSAQRNHIRLARGHLAKRAFLFRYYWKAKYAHPVRVLAPVQPLETLVEEGAIKAGAVTDLRGFDHLANYFYVPAIPDAGLPESVALLYMPITIHHDYLEERRIAQLSRAGAIHLKRQLAAHFGGELFGHEDFDD